MEAKAKILKVLQKTISDDPSENCVRVIRDDATIEVLSMADYDKEVAKEPKEKP